MNHMVISTIILKKKNHKTLTKGPREMLEAFNTQLNRLNFKWCLTATPFNYGPFNLMGILNYIISNQDKSSLQKDINDYSIVKGFSSVEEMEKIVKTHFRGIKKSDVKNEIDIPIFTEKIINIPLSNIEKNIYNSHKGNTMYNNTYSIETIKKLFLIVYKYLYCKSV